MRTTTTPDTVAATSPMLSPRAVCHLLGISATTLWRIAQQSPFPPKFAISPNRVAFREDQIRAWLETREIARTGARDRDPHASVEPRREEDRTPFRDGDVNTWRPA